MRAVQYVQALRNRIFQGTYFAIVRIVLLAKIRMDVIE